MSKEEVKKFIEENSWLIEQVMSRMEDRRGEIDGLDDFRDIFQEEVKKQLDDNIELYNFIMNNEQARDALFQIAM